MKYYLDTEFHEYQKKPLFGKPIDTIEFISIGVVAEDGREYYAISKDFDIKAAWNSYQLKINKQYPSGPKYTKVYWLRENVLKPIWEELKVKEYGGSITRNFCYSNFKWLINEYGKSRQQIAEEVKDFCEEGNKNYYYLPKGQGVRVVNDKGEEVWQDTKYCSSPEFYAYYADYDWVVFCWLFGRMIDLPDGFPMYCIDLKQELDRKLPSLNGHIDTVNNRLVGFNNKKHQLEYIKSHRNYPKQTNEHNALADAKWNKKLHKFLNQL